MPRIYSQVYQPYTYDELIKPLQASTEAHKEIEKEYNANMLVVESLRQRAENELETNPDSRWAKNIIEYADRLEGYAGELSKNGLSMDIKNNVMDMYKSNGKILSPVMKAMEREQALQAVRDKAVGTNMVFGAMPSLDEIIDNPNIGQTAYNWDDIYTKTSKLAQSMSKRNIKIFDPYNYNEYLYKYGKQKGFSNEDIEKMLQNDPGFRDLFKGVIDSYGFANDRTLNNEQINKLANAIVVGALEGFEYDEDWNYKDIPVPKNTSGKSGKSQNGGTDDFGYVYSIQRPKVTAIENQNLVNGYSDIINKINDGIKTGKINENIFQKTINHKYSYDEYLESLGYTLHEGIMDIQDNVYIPTWITDSEGNKISFEDKQRLKEQYSNIKSIDEIAKKYGIQPTKDNLDIISDLVKIDLAENAVQSQYYINNDNHARSMQLQQEFYNAMDGFLDGKTHLMDSETKEDYVRKDSDWMRKNNKTGSFNIIYDPSNKEKPFVIRTNGTELIPKSDFFADKEINNRIIKGNQASELYTERRNQIKKDLKNALRDIQHRPHVYLPIIYQIMYNPNKIYDLSQILTDEFRKQNSSGKYEPAKPITKKEKEMINDLCRALIQRTMLMFDESKENIFRDKQLSEYSQQIDQVQKDIFKRIESEFANQLQGDSQTDKAIYDDLTGR